MAENQEQQENVSVGHVAKKSATTTIIIIALLLIVLSGGTLGVLLYTPLGDKLLNKHKQEKAPGELSPEELLEMEKKAKEITFLSLPEMIVNLKTSKGKGNILKTTFVLQVANDKEREKIEKFTPLIIDQFQTFLRELDIIDVQGAAGIERIRQELFTRINQIISPFKIKEILVKDFLVQ
ncbi:MAG: hypothetical protein CNLJKLNK_00933 [Holosporales bacterium]